MTDPLQTPPVILVVDDEKHMHMLLQLCLGRTGAKVRFASLGSEAVTICAGGGIDLIVLDYMMPGMDGVETLRQLRAQPQSAAIPVIMLTSRGQEDFRREAERMGVVHFFAKPFSPAELARTAGGYLRRP
jgi:CheY-like chemotaxis protein